MQRFIVGLGFAFISLGGINSALAENMASDGSRRADDFVSKGMYTTLRECILPGTCGGESFLKQKRIRRHTANDYLVDQRTLDFDGLKIELWYVLAYPSPDPASSSASIGKVKAPYKKPEILSVRVTSPRWPVAQGLRVGVSRSSVLKKLGTGQAQGSCLQYVNERKQDAVTFCFQGDRVKSIEWTPWNDA